MANVDPVSGNEIPPGGAPEEVRDNIPIKASEGEYMLPADVVKYFGLDYIEKLITKAKTGMEELQANGRIGGSGPDDLPFSPEELVAHEQELAAEAAPAEEVPMQMAVGGFVSPLQNKVSGPVASSIMTQPGATVAPTAMPLPSWMQDPNSEEAKKPTLLNDNEGAGRGSTAEATGFGRAVGDWETKDYSDYAESKNNPVRGLADKVFSKVSPLAGMAIKAATKYTDKKALGRMQEMLSTGVGPTGQPLSPEEVKSLTEAQKSLSEEKPSVSGGIGGLLGNLLEKAIAPKKEEKPQEKKQAEKPSGAEKAGASREGGSKGSSSGSSSGGGARGGDKTGGRSMAKGGLVTRR